MCRQLKKVENHWSKFLSVYINFLPSLSTSLSFSLSDFDGRKCPITAVSKLSKIKSSVTHCLNLEKRSQSWSDFFSREKMEDKESYDNTRERLICGLNLKREILSTGQLSLLLFFCLKAFTKYSIQWPPVNRITFGQHKSDNFKHMITLTIVFVYCVSTIWDWY